MALMVSTGAYFHWVERLTAESNTPGALKLTVHGDSAASNEQNNSAEILLFMEDHGMIARLVAAINGAAARPPVSIYGDRTDSADI